MDMDRKNMETRLSMESPLVDPVQVEDSLVYFEDQIVIVKNGDSSSHLEVLELVASNGGWTNDQISRLIHVITTTPAPVQITRSMLSSLVPGCAVSTRSLLQLVFWLDTVSDYVMLSGLKVVCLCLQYNCVTDVTQLGQLYEMFIAWLEKEKLTGVICDILLVLSDKLSVTKWRVSRVLATRSKLGSSSQLDHLIWTYRQLRPDLVPHCPAPVSRSGPMSSLLAKRFHNVWEYQMDNNKDTDNLWSSAVNQITKTTFKKSGRDRLVPHGEVLNVPIKKAKMSLTDCKTVHQLVENFHQIVLPANILSLLDCKVNLMVLASDQSLVERLSITLYHTLYNEFQGGQGENKGRRREKLLNKLAELQEKLQQGLPVIGRFLAEWLSNDWDGRTHFHQILRLVALTQITDFKEIYDCILIRFEEHFTSYNQVEHSMVLVYLHSLVRYWVTVEYGRYNNLKSGIFPISSHNCSNALESIKDLIDYVSEISLSFLSLAKDKIERTDLLLNQVIGLNRASQKIILAYKVPVRIHLPNHFVYSAMFSGHQVHLSQVCKFVLTDKKDVLPTLKRLETELEAQGDSLNSLVAGMISPDNLDVMKTAIWDLLAFLSPGRVEVMPNSILHQIWVTRGDIDETSLRESLYIASHPAFLPQVMNYLDDLGKREKQEAWLALCVEPDNQTSKEKGNIFNFFRFLSRMMPSIPELVMTFIPPVENSDNKSVASRMTVDSGVFSEQRTIMGPPTGSKKRKLSGNKEKEVNKRKNIPTTRNAENFEEDTQVNRKISRNSKKS